MKKIVLASILFIVCGTYSAADPLPVLFAWDMHETLMRKYISPSTEYLTISKQILIKKIYKGIRQGYFNKHELQLIYQWNPHINDLGKLLAGEYFPTAGMVELLKELHELGHKHFIAANISAHELQQLKERFPYFFSYFSGEQVVDFRKEHPIKKPQLNYFINFQNKFNPKRRHTVIFIDEKQTNIDSALKAGMLAIRFDTVQKLKNNLKKLQLY